MRGGLSGRRTCDGHGCRSEVFRAVKGLPKACEDTTAVCTTVTGWRPGATLDGPSVLRLAPAPSDGVASPPSEGDAQRRAAPEPFPGLSLGDINTHVPYLH